jgi:hypothetical protein
MNSPPKNKPPESAPEGTTGTPEFDPVTGVVETNHLLVGMISFTDNAKMLHLNTGVSQLFHSRLGRLVTCENGDD